MRYVLMCKEHEVLEFDIDFPSETVHGIHPLEDVAWAPLGVFDGQSLCEQNLSDFVHDRRISFARADLPAVLEATGARSSVELAFRSGGFSLSDPYWYRTPGSALTWAQGNFFDNEWDPAFGEAVLQGDYRALAKASVATPDVTCSGASRKAWFRDEEGPRLLKAPVEEHGASMVAEVLTSRMLARLLPEDEFVPYELVEHNGETYSASRPITGADEELAMAWQALSATERARAGETSADSLLGRKLLEELGSALSHLNVEGGSQVLAKMQVIAHLVFYRDMHSNNLGVIRAVDSGALRLAPFFDFDRAFCLSNRERMKSASENSHVAMLLMASTFSDLDPSWDYSWYDPHALDGFEFEMEHTLAACDAVPRGYVQLVTKLFAAQREYVNGIAAGEVRSPASKQGE